MSESPPEFISATDRASYEVIPIVENPVVNRGGEININFYFSGNGLNPPNSKLYINYGGIQLESSNPGVITTSIEMRTSEDISDSDIEDVSEEDLFIAAGSNAMNERDIQPDESGFVHSVGPHFFENKEVEPPFTFQPIYSEVSHNACPPISISINLDDNVSPGDYEITSVLTYGNEEVVKQSKSVNSIHVNSRVEQYRFQIVVFGLILTFSTLLLDIPVSDIVSLIFS